MSNQLHNIINDVVSRLAAAMGVEYQIDIEDPSAEDGVVAVRIRTEDEARFLIGKNGQNLAALEHIMRAVCYRRVGTERRVTVDVNDYRHERAQQLVESTRALVARVRDTGHAQTMLPMSPAERRIVHTELASYTDVASESTGEDPYRRVVIKPIVL
jgi:spoIIIJ-associated protein